VVDDDAPRAQLLDQVERVCHEQDRLAGLLELRDLREALARERLVADGEHLVHQQDVRVDVDGDGEGQLDVLTRGVVLDRVVDARACSEKSTIESKRRSTSFFDRPSSAALR